jgi:phage tail-like protein
MAAHRFTVRWGKEQAGFSEVSGLLPARMRKLGSIRLERGVVRGGGDLFRWLTSTKLDNPERRDLVVSMLDERQRPVQVWKVVGALPVKLEGPPLQADANEVTIESIELTHEGLELQGS